MLDQSNCVIADEAAEAERETAAYVAQRRADWEAWVDALPTKDQRYFHRDKVKRTYESAMVRAGKAAPRWLSPEDKRQILAVYEAAEALHMATGIPHEVDHIVQLFGKNKTGEQVICGLHVPSNLRAIPKSLNRKRGDWFFIADCEQHDPDGRMIYGFESGGDDEIPF